LETFTQKITWWYADFDSGNRQFQFVHCFNKKMQDVSKEFDLYFSALPIHSDLDSIKNQSKLILPEVKLVVLQKKEITNLLEAYRDSPSIEKVKLNELKKDDVEIIVEEKIPIFYERNYRNQIDINEKKLKKLNEINLEEFKAKQIMYSFQNYSTSESSVLADEIESRERSLSEMESTIKELSDIFKDLGSIVEEQGSLIDNIDVNISNSSSHVKEGSKELMLASSVSPSLFSRAKRGLFQKLNVFGQQKRSSSKSDTFFNDESEDDESFGVSENISERKQISKSRPLSLSSQAKEILPSLRQKEKMSAPKENEKMAAPKQKKKNGKSTSYKRK